MDPTNTQGLPQIQQMSPLPQGGGDLSSLLQRLTPEQLHEMMGLGSLSEQDSHLDRQAAQAHALRSGLMAQHPMGWGAGAANGISQVLGALHERQLDSRHDDILAQQTAGRGRFADLFRGPQAQAAQPPGSALDALTAPAVSPPFSFGP